MSINLFDSGGGGGGSASQVNEIVYLNNDANTVTLDDGRVYLKGNVYETTVSNYPDAFTSYQPAGLNFSVASQDTQPNAVATDGTNFYVVGSQNNKISKYNSSGVFQWDALLSSQGSNPKGITCAGSYLWVLLGATAYRYNLTNGVYTSVSMYIGSQDSSPVGITFDGFYLWVVGASTNKVYKYNTSNTYQNVSFSVASQTNAPEDIAWDGTYFYVLDAYQKVYKYNASGVYQGVAFTSTANAAPRGIVSKGGGDTSFFITGRTAQSVTEYKPAVGIASNNTAVAGVGQNYVRVK